MLVVGLSGSDRETFPLRVADGVSVPDIVGALGVMSTAIRRVQPRVASSGGNRRGGEDATAPAWSRIVLRAAEPRVERQAADRGRV